MKVQGYIGVGYGAIQNMVRSVYLEESADRLELAPTYAVNHVLHVVADSFNNSFAHVLEDSVSDTSNFSRIFFEIPGGCDNDFAPIWKNL